MKPIMFPESNKVLVKPQGMTDEECRPLHVFNDGIRSVSCWKMRWKERFRALITGEVWLIVWGGKTSPPVCVTVDKPLEVPGLKKVERVDEWPNPPEASKVHTNPNPTTRAPLLGKVVIASQGSNDSPYPQDQERRIIR